MRIAVSMSLIIGLSFCLLFNTNEPLADENLTGTHIAGVILNKVDLERDGPDNKGDEPCVDKAGCDPMTCYSPAMYALFSSLLHEAKHMTQSYSTEGMDPDGDNGRVQIMRVGLRALVATGDEIDPREASTIELADMEPTVRIGRYGPFLELKKDGDSVTASKPLKKVAVRPDGKCMRAVNRRSTPSAVVTCWP